MLKNSARCFQTLRVRKVKLITFWATMRDAGNTYLSISEYSESLKSVGEVLDVCYDIPQMIKSDNHREIADKTCCDIKKLIDASRRKFKEFEDEKIEQLVVEREKNNLNDELRANNAFEFFEHIWTFTNNFWLDY